MLVDFMPG